MSGSSAAQIPKPLPPPWRQRAKPSLQPARLWPAQVRPSIQLAKAERKADAPLRKSYTMSGNHLATIPACAGGRRSAFC